MPRSPGTLLALIAAFALAAVALAVVLQYGFDMQPCAWCSFQRVLFIAVALAALLARALQRVRPAHLAAVALTVLLAAGGVWAALHHPLVAAPAESCVYTFADRFLIRSGLDWYLPWLFEARASCAEANAPLLGLPFAAWSAALFLILGAMALAALRTGPRN
ncbi:MAG: disulfide bond formation protein B [Burkholderiaceae bacterium]